MWDNEVDGPRPELLGETMEQRVKHLKVLYQYPISTPLEPKPTTWRDHRHYTIEELEANAVELEKRKGRIRL